MVMVADGGIFQMNNLVLAVVFLFAGWGFGLDADIGRVQIFFKHNQVGDGRDFFLVKESELTGSYDHVAVIFGYGDDSAVCAEVIEAFVTKYPQNTYECRPAN